MWPSSMFNFIKMVATGESDPLAEADSCGITYITKRLIAMGFPHCDDASALMGTIVEQKSSLELLSGYLNSHHHGRYIIWNLSEQAYDYAKFDDQVIDFRFPGYPAPPLHQLCSICDAIDAWLRADDQNVAVLHCQNGTGRTFTVMACYLAWIGQFRSPQKALLFIVKAKQVSLIESIIPTQMRYVEYFNHIIRNKLPSGKPLFLKRIVMNTIPAFGPNGSCRPYLQIFKNAKLVFSSTWQSKIVKAYTPEDGAIVFPIDAALDGDILIRIRHLMKNGDRVSMLRFGFHTGYIQTGNTRFTRNELDGSDSDERFMSDFLLDMICTPPLDETGAEIERGEFDQAFWKNMASRKVSEAEARKMVTPSKFAIVDDDATERVNLSGFAIDDDDDDLHRAMDVSRGSETHAVLRALSDTFSTGRSTLSSLVSNFASPAPAISAATTTDLSTKITPPILEESYDDLEQFIKGIGEFTVDDYTDDNTLPTDQSFTVSHTMTTLPTLAVRTFSTPNIHKDVDSPRFMSSDSILASLSPMPSPQPPLIITSNRGLSQLNTPTLTSSSVNITLKTKTDPVLVVSSSTTLSNATITHQDEDDDDDLNDSQFLASMLKQIDAADGDLDDDDTPLDLSQFSDQLSADDDIKIVDRPNTTKVSSDTVLFQDLP